MRRFHTIVLDPPWPQSGGGKIKRGADRHYRLCKNKQQVLDAIVTCPQLNIGQPGFRPAGVAENAHGYMWCPKNQIMDAGWLIEQLGGKYITQLMWDKRTVTGKRHPGLGRYFRGCFEPVLFFTWGVGTHNSVMTKARDVLDLIEGQRGKHSEKPDEFYDIVKRRSKGPFLDVFSRKERKGGTCWGPDEGIGNVVEPKSERKTYNLRIGSM